MPKSSFVFVSGCFAPRFLCPLWFLGECGDYVFPDRKLFWDPDRFAHQGLQVKCVSKYCKLILRNGYGLGGVGMRGSTGGRKQGFPRNGSRE